MTIIAVVKESGNWKSFDNFVIWFASRIEAENNAESKKQQLQDLLDFL